MGVLNEQKHFLPIFLITTLAHIKNLFNGIKLPFTAIL